MIAQKDLQAAALAARNNGGSVQGAGVGGSGGYNFGNTGEQCEVFVPKIAVGVVIGKGGDMIRKIQTECGCKLQFIQGKNDEPGDRRCLIQGTRQQVDDAKRMIDGLIENMMVSILIHILIFILYLNIIKFYKKLCHILCSKVFKIFYVCDFSNDNNVMLVVAAMAIWMETIPITVTVMA